MNKTAIKNFAIWARNKLISDISYRAGLMGITAEGIQYALPQSTGETEFYDIGTAEPYAISGEAVKQRRQLVEVIHRKERDSDYQTAYKYIIEEVAYTWFNRLIAVRFMEVNEYLPSRIRVLSSETGKLEPDLVTNPFDAELPFTDREEQKIMQLGMDNQVDELFRLLFIKQCNALNEILPALFEKTNDYTELLLNLSVIDEDGVVYHLVHDIPENDFNVAEEGQVEIIGWLYQYYNTEPKDETFALLKKNVKISKERIPFATQLFTPDWIVRYMVENSLGRLWVEGHPDEELKTGWKYYLEEAEQEPDVVAQLEKVRAEYRNINPEDIKIIDPCMGSGHILVYCFDILMQIYETQGYSQRDAVQSILEHNLFGLDIDNRAAQLSYFAVMMKARQYDRRIFSRGIMPHIYAIKESNGINRGQLCYFGAGLNDVDKKTALSEITELLDMLVDAKEYGSILNVKNYNWDLLCCFVESVDVEGQMTLDAIGIEQIQEMLHLLVEIGQMMAQKYDVVITNPPYMGTSGMDSILSKYLKNKYPDSKVDLFAVFIERCSQMIKQNGYQAMITQHSWMFLTSFRRLRIKLCELDIVNLLHLGARAFEEIGGEVVQTTSFVLRNTNVNNYFGVYSRLVDYSSQRQKEVAYLEKKNIYFASKKQYSLLPDDIIIYWISKDLVKLFENNLLENFVDIKQGVATSDNNRFLRLWFEVEYNTIGFGLSHSNAINSTYKWFPYNKGGSAIRWYGNQDYVINYYNDGEEIKAFHEMLNKEHPGGRLKNQEFYFREGFTWSTLSNVFAVRYCPQGFIFDTKGSMGFARCSETLKAIMGMLNSVVGRYWMHILAPTLDFNPISLRHIPFMLSMNPQVIEDVDKCITLSRELWDYNEVSWNFERPLFCMLDNAVTVRAAIEYGEVYANKLKNLINDAEQHIDDEYVSVYGLEKEIQYYDDSGNHLSPKFTREDMIKSLLSYAVGCMFGRYSLDLDRLAYAGGEWDDGKYSTFIPDKDNVIPITDEEYLEDDIVGLLCAWLKKVYGAETLEENLDFIAAALGNKGGASREIIRNYFLNDFMKDHIKVYQKRPIYWLFDSGKQNGFKALIYLHRYTPDTIGNLRIDYLHQMQRIYESEINRMQDMIDHSTNAREVATATKRKEKLQKQLKECHDYDEKIAHLALSRIELDLDDGVKVNYEKVQTARDGKKYQVLTKI